MVQIAIYSRKSRWSGRGDSVENQVTLCKEYIDRFIEPLDAVTLRIYEDEGFSGKNTRRPQFQQMMRDIRRESFQYLVCYRLDRLGRNLIDLATLIEEMKQREISFVSVKERFDTSTPMGKAMLYFAGVLAQMEREQIAERVRDNMYLLARSGRWLGGNTPFGYESAGEKQVQLDGKIRKTWYLKERKEECAWVVFLFQQYQATGSLTKTAALLARHDIRTRNNRAYTPASVRDILRNPVYCQADADSYAYFRERNCHLCLTPAQADGSRGYLCYGKTSSGNRPNPPKTWILARGKHPGLIPGKDFVAVQKLLDRNRCHKTKGRVQNEEALLCGLLYCSCGCAMRPKSYKTARFPQEGRRFSYRCTGKDHPPALKKTQEAGLPAPFSAPCSRKNLQGNTLDHWIYQQVVQALEEAVNSSAVPDKMTGHSRDFGNEAGLLPLPDDVPGVSFSPPIPSGLIEAEQHRSFSSGNSLPSEYQLLQLTWQERKRQQENLWYTLAQTQNSPVFIRQIQEKIQTLSMEQRQLESRMQKLKDMQKEEKARFRTSGKALPDNRSVWEKRELLKQIFQRIEWDGNHLRLWYPGESQSQIVTPPKDSHR